MKLSQFKFKLPEDKIALYPAKYRDESRLMVVHKSTGEIEHVIFKDILNYFDDKDVLFGRHAAILTDICPKGYYIDNPLGD